MQSDKAQVHKLPVRCDCNSGQLSAPSFDETLAIVGAASKAVHGVNPFPQHSPFHTKPCAKCEGEGFINVANGPDDFDKEVCVRCHGNGRYLAIND
jgi:hypothetical protein